MSYRRSRIAPYRVPPALFAMWLATGGSILIGVAPIARALFGPLPTSAFLALGTAMGAPFGIAIGLRMQPDRDALLYFLRVYATIGVMYLCILGFTRGLGAL